MGYMKGKPLNQINMADIAAAESRQFYNDLDEHLAEYEASEEFAYYYTPWEGADEALDCN
jgi:hypothetical protein